MPQDAFGDRLPERFLDVGAATLPVTRCFPPVQTEREGQGTQAAELAAIFSRAALTGQPDFPSHRVQASPQPSP